MLNERKKIMEAKIENNSPKKIDKLMIFSDNVSRLYFDIINNTTESLWWHCTSIILQYIFLLFFSINISVSIIIN